MRTQASELRRRFGLGRPRGGIRSPGPRDLRGGGEAEVVDEIGSAMDQVSRESGEAVMMWCAGRAVRPGQPAELTSRGARTGIACSSRGGCTYYRVNLSPAVDGTL